MIDYQNKRIVIIGLGITGQSCVDYFLEKGVVPRVIDTREQPNGLDQLDSRVDCHLGSLNLDWLLDSDLIIASPGIALSTPELKQAYQAGIEIIGDIELFCREVNQQVDKKIIAITGSNGKTTVTTLVGEIIKAAGIAAGVGGNIGEPALSLLKKNNDVYVLELSSFQLETTHSLHATAATILNITEDHMDRYPEGIVKYAAAKQRIYYGAKNCILNCDDPLTYPLEEIIATCIEFGLQKGCYHLDQQYKHLMMQDEILLATSSLQLIGLHNFTNVLAALALVDVIGIPREVSLNVIQNFKGLSHRFELVHFANGVSWINDSKATNVGSTEAALKNLVNNGHLYLLLGGDGKDANFSSLKPYLDADNLSIYCFGQDKQALAQLRPEVTIVTETMADAMQDIAKRVKENDVVLLSPACASLDQFKNYVERGNIFTQLAKELG